MGCGFVLVDLTPKCKVTLLCKIYWRPDNTMQFLSEQFLIWILIAFGWQNYSIKMQYFRLSDQ